MAYTPTATANTVAVLLSADEAEGMTRHLSKLMSAPMHPRVASASIGVDSSRNNAGIPG
jgi:hypothetical protein